MVLTTNEIGFKGLFSTTDPERKLRSNTQRPTEEKVLSDL